MKVLPLRTEEAAVPIVARGGHIQDNNEEQQTATHPRGKAENLRAGVLLCVISSAHITKLAIGEFFVIAILF